MEGYLKDERADTLLPHPVEFEASASDLIVAESMETSGFYQTIEDNPDQVKTWVEGRIEQILEQERQRREAERKAYETSNLKRVVIVL
ncbi:hypothetical protein [uncultured Roseobacter sp.]|uniref:hypothetical protein n=1 Tax=uncultured Roseobacter sp. TaxID=114847 RepID=UPI002602CFD5|nr:hypothetical protein [uncultured Roseobacter sp.]